MKKSLLIIVIASLFLNSCLTASLIDNKDQKEREKTIEFVKKSYFKGYEKYGTIEEIFSKTERHEWYTEKEIDRCSSMVQIKYTDTKTFETLRVKLIFDFKYDKKNNEAIIEKIFDVYSRKEYSTPSGIEYIMSTFVVIVNMKNL